MTRQLAPCGTDAAYLRHLRHLEEACAACKAANSGRSARYRAAVAGRKAGEKAS